MNKEQSYSDFIIEQVRIRGGIKVERTLGLGIQNLNMNALFTDLGLLWT
jgi:hypothetical protein